jgi:hypothetical protein
MDPDQRRDASHAGRLWRRLLVGAVIGFVVCGLVGLVIGLVAYRPGSIAMWVAFLGAGFFGGVVGAIAGGMSSLESPDPGSEPSQFSEPVTEPGGLTRPETDQQSGPKASESQETLPERD